MSDIKMVIRNLKARMRAEHMTYRQLAGKVGLSEPTIKRDLSRGAFTLQRLEQFCEALNVTLSELLQPPARSVLLTELSAEQEQALVSNPKLLVTTYLIVNDWKFSEIIATFRITDNELVGILLKLERLGIAEYRPPQRMRKLTARNFSWRKDGPIQMFFLKRVVPEFFDDSFEGASDELRFINGTLSQESLRQFRAGIDRLAAEFEQLAHHDARLPLDDRNGCSAILALRAWEFSEFTRLRRTPRSVAAPVKARR
jgi:transcriptional regulator with XRE-family HTH domain